MKNAVASLTLIMLITSIPMGHAAAINSPLALPASTHEKLQKMSFSEFVSDWTFFWSAQPVDAELENSLHTIYQVDGDQYLSETLATDLNSGFRSYCAAHGGRIEATGHNFHPRRLNGLICKTSQTSANGYLKYEIKREGDFMYTDVWFVPESDYIDSEEVASRDKDYHFRWLRKY